MTEARQSADYEAGVCGFCHPPPEDSADREQLDRFADFLRIVGSAPRDEQGRYIIGERAYRYAMGEDVAPIAPELNDGPGGGSDEAQ